MKDQIKNLEDIKKLLHDNKNFLAVLAIFIFLIYANVIPGEFLTADDIRQVVIHPTARDISGAFKTLNLERIYTSILNVAFNTSSSAFHVVSILLHTANASLTFILIYLLTKRKDLAMITALLFAAHPVNVEAVAWISGKMYLFFALFTLTSLIFFILFKDTKNKKFLNLSVLSFLLGTLLTQNPWMLINPILLVIIDQFFYEKKLNFKNIPNYVPYAIATLIYVFLFLTEQYTARVSSLATGNTQSTPLLNRIPYTVFMGMRLLFWPLELTLHHEGKFISPAMYKIMILATISLFIYISRLWKKDRKTTGLILLIILSILPTFSPTLIAWFIAERYLYIGSIFFCLIIAQLITKLGEKYKVKNLTKYAVGTLLIFYSVRTVIRTNDFKLNKNLWIATQKTSPYSARVYNNLGDVYSTEGNWDLAVQNFEKAIEIKPDYSEAMHNLGYTYIQMGDLESAEKHLKQSLEVNPKLHQALYKLGVIEYNRENPTGAIQYFEKVLEINRGDIQTLQAIQAVKREMGD